MWQTFKSAINGIVDFEVVDMDIYRGNYGNLVNYTVPFDDKGIKGKSFIVVKEVPADPDADPSSITAVRHLSIAGKLSKTIDTPNPDLPQPNQVEQDRRCFCAFKSYFSRVFDLRNYEGIELVIRSQSTIEFKLNLSTVTLVPEDLYQLRMTVIGGNQWQTIRIPFEIFTLTAGGRSKLLHSACGRKKNRSAFLTELSENDSRKIIPCYYSFIHLFIYSFIHLFVYSFIHLFIYSFIHIHNIVRGAQRGAVGVDLECFGMIFQHELREDEYQCKICSPFIYLLLLLF
jgi:hypothetical protein